MKILDNRGRKNRIIKNLRKELSSLRDRYYYRFKEKSYFMEYHEELSKNNELISELNEIKDKYIKLLAALKIKGIQDIELTS